ncbi:BgTH12-00948 [Blumeria graminis f. sp. triticale]|uniref:BgtE-5721 n=3 Tax=Blumeria graminis TaxID=34373 RepID=A0A061HLX8_BLUGR|nr:putative secreted effector protein [Blumeria graminis f. sp. tritici 96224]CAD6505457.1 BgTH12-00948 [Blumeria graminis f. sp. triticale]VDB93595.1 BgtE-5721 [Blumeria graminis f. sp. tritici]
MACVVALLLASAKIQTSNRMVLVTDKQSDYSYTVITHINTLLPAPEKIYMSSLPIKYSSTTSAVYCSTVLNSEDIVRSISNSAKDSKEVKDQENNDDELESNGMKCFENIKAIAKRKWIRPVYSSELDKSLCQTKTLIDLFYKGVVLPPKKYKKFFPENGKGATRRIVINEKIHIGELVQDGKIYQHSEWNTNLSVLAWYRGNLHIFKIGKHGWYPLTKIGNEALNGPMIYLFMLGTDKGPWNSKKFRFDEVLSGLKVLAEGTQVNSFHNHLMFPYIPLSPQVKMNLAKLNAISPVGTISTR